MFSITSADDRAVVVNSQKGLQQLMDRVHFLKPNPVGSVSYTHLTLPTILRV